GGPTCTAPTGYWCRSTPGRPSSTARCTRSTPTASPSKRRPERAGSYSKRNRRPTLRHADDLELLLVDVDPGPLIDVGAVGGARSRDVEDLAAVAVRHAVVARPEVRHLPLLVSGARPRRLVDVAGVGRAR